MPEEPGPRPLPRTPVHRRAVRGVVFGNTGTARVLPRHSRVAAILRLSRRAIAFSGGSVGRTPGALDLNTLQGSRPLPGTHRRPVGAAICRPTRQLPGVPEQL